MGAKSTKGKVVPEATPADANPNIPYAGVGLPNIDAVPVGTPPPTLRRFVNSARDNATRVFPSVNTRQREIPSAIATPVSAGELRRQLNAERRRRLRPIIENDPLIRELRSEATNINQQLMFYEDNRMLRDMLSDLNKRISERARQIYDDYTTYP